MKKFLSTFIVFAMLSMMLAGCQSAGDVKGNNNQGSGNEKPYEMVLACGSPENSTVAQFLIKYKEYVDEHSNERINVNVYPNSQLGGEREILEGIQSGSVTMIAGSSAPQVNFVSDVAIFDMPFAFANNKKAREVLSDPEFLSALSSKYEEAGFKLVTITDGEFRQLSSNKKVETPNDLKGLNVRTMENKYHMAAWKELGANPTPLPGNEIYTALQQGTVDAQENPIQLIYSSKFYEQQKYVILTNHVHHTCPVVMNLSFYNSLPEDLQKILDEAAVVALDFSFDFTDSNVDSDRKTMEDHGVKFIDLTPDELKPFADKAKNMWSMIEKDCSPEVYNSFRKLLD